MFTINKKKNDKKRRGYAEAPVFKKKMSTKKTDEEETDAGSSVVDNEMPCSGNEVGSYFSHKIKVY